MNVHRYSIRMTMLALVLLVFIGGWLLLPDADTPLAERQAPASLTEEQVIIQYYAPLEPVRIGEVSVQASVARTPEERQQGLSGTPYLPEGVVKLFVFDAVGDLGIWMKDMQYPIDILWLDTAGQVVHIEDMVQPNTYVSDTNAEVFNSPVPAQYVIETKAGFVAENDIRIGSYVDLPSS